MNKRSEKNEGRLRVWLPESKRWIREALEHLSTYREAHDSIPSSVSLEVVNILERELCSFMGRRRKKILRIEFREKDEWVYDEILEVVRAKKALGHGNVSVNFEAGRLLKAALLCEKGALGK